MKISTIYIQYNTLFTITSKYLEQLIIPCEARAEGLSVARLINLSGRAGPSGAKPREFERKIHLYIYVYIFEGVRTMMSDCLASSGAKFAYIEKNMRAL